MANVIEERILLDSNTGDSSDNNIVITERVYIKFDSVVTDSMDAITSAGYEIGQSHRNRDFISLESISGEALTGSEWYFTHTYSSNQTKNNVSSDSPLDYKPTIDHGIWTYQRVVTKDKENGNDIVNSAGDPFDSPILEEIACPTLSVTVRKNAPNMQNIEKVGSINSEAFKLVSVDIPKYCAQLADYRVNLNQDQDGFFYYENTFIFKLNFNKSKETGDTIGFKTEVANTGFRRLNTEGVKTDIKLDGVELSVPAFLTEDGSDITDTPNYKQFVVNDLEDFKTLNLPTRYPQY